MALRASPLARQPARRAGRASGRPVVRPASQNARRPRPLLPRTHAARLRRPKSSQRVLSAAAGWPRAPNATRRRGKELPAVQQLLASPRADPDPGWRGARA